MGTRTPWLTSDALPLISDIHGDIAALRHVLAELRSLGIDRPPMILGDSFWTGDRARDPHAVLRQLMSGSWEIVIRGNTEEYLLSGRLEHWTPATAEDAREQQFMLEFLGSLSCDQRQWIRSLPMTHRFRFGHRQCLATHASPANIEQGLVLDADKAHWQHLLAHAPAKVVITGHLHRGFTHLVGDVTHICVGAIGRHERDYDGIIDYAILDATPSGLAVVYQRTQIDARGTSARRLAAAADSTLPPRESAPP